MFGSLFSRNNVQHSSYSTIPATMPAELPASLAAKSTATLQNTRPNTQMQQLLAQALQDVGIDMHHLPADWRQRVTVELLRQVRGPQASFQIDPLALKTLLTQLASQPASQPALQMALQPALRPASQNAPSRAAHPGMASARAHATSSVTPKASSHERQSHLDIFQL
jgi:hypothetical protein